MAIKQDEECYTKWTHAENGKVLVRRIHRIEVQARNGGLYVLRGDKLPDFIQTSAGIPAWNFASHQTRSRPCRRSSMW